MPESLPNLAERLPLVLLFCTGYLLYRVLVVSGVTRVLADGLLRRAHGRLRGMLLQVMALAAVLSMLIPNTVVVLALLPVVKQLIARVAEPVRESTASPVLPTAFMLALVYGANIGGMGSLIGSPAHLWLIGWLDVLDVPGRASLSFGSWLIWAAPLSAVLLLLAWGTLVLLGLPRRTDLPSHPLAPATGTSRPAMGRAERLGALLTAAYVGFWLAESVLRALAPDQPLLPAGLALAFAAGFTWACLGWRSLASPADPSHPATTSRRALMRPRDLFVGVPVRGLLLLAILGVLMVAGRLLGLESLAASVVGAGLPEAPGPVALHGLLALTTIAATEVLSNTLVAAAFLPLGHALAIAADVPPLGVMITISLASTAAFMTPIATPCNALAFGEIRGASLARMLGIGAVLNLMTVAIMALWLPVALPWVHGG